MKRLVVLPLALMLAAASSALAQDVRYNFDKSTDFSKLKTYKWVVLKDAPKLSDLVDEANKAQGAAPAA